ARGMPWDRAMRRLPKRLWLLYLNAAQSEMFNRVLAARTGWLDSLLPGDIAFLHSSGAVFRVEDPSGERHRLEALEISPTGPLFGAKMLQPEGKPGDIESSILAEYGLTGDNFLGRWSRHLPGERRPLRVPLSDPDAKITPEGIELRFALPPGSYATSVLRELAKKET
ncbi:MAG: tRNA pseudouridine(13) synthase TruD, partial [Planctomycetota bacterium]|nr:tRNA pseudouridine(13) synthase TruD [Planctomycetota bacterium]